MLARLSVVEAGHVRPEGGRVERLAAVAEAEVDA